MAATTDVTIAARTTAPPPDQAPLTAAQTGFFPCRLAAAPFRPA